MPVTTMKQFLRALHRAMRQVQPDDFQALAKAHARFSELSHWARVSEQPAMESIALDAVRKLEDIILERDENPNQTLVDICLSLPKMYCALAGKSVKVTPLPGGYGDSASRVQAAKSEAARLAHRAEEIAAALLTLAADPADSRAFDTVQAFFDDLQSVPVPSLNGFCDAVDDLFSALDDGRTELDGAALESLCEAVDVARTALNAMREDHDTANSGLHDRVHRLCARIEAICRGEIGDGADRALVAKASEKRLGELLIDSGAATPQDVERALTSQDGDPMQRRLGELLVSSGQITQAQLDEAIHIQEEDGSLGKLGDILVETGAIAPDQLAHALKGQHMPDRPRLGEILVREGRVETREVAKVVGSQGVMRDLFRMGVRAVGRLFSLNDVSVPGTPGYDPEVVRDFAACARDHIRALEVQLLALESNPNDAEKIGAILRILHQLKRVSGFLCLHEFHACARGLERLLKLGRRRTIDLEGPALEAAFDAVELLKRLRDRIETAAQAGTAIESEPAFSVEMARIDALAQGGAAEGSWTALDPSAVLNKKLGELLVDAGVTTDGAIQETLAAQADTPAQRRLGELLIERGLISGDELEQAIAKQKESGNNARLGDILQQMGLLDASSLDAALRSQQSGGKPRLGEMLVRTGRASSRDIARVLHGQNLARDLVRFGLSASKTERPKRGGETLSDEDKELIDGFVERARRHLEVADLRLLALEETPGDDSALQDLRRAVRSLKRVGGYIGLQQVRSITFEFEKILDAANRGELRIEHAVLDLCFDAIETLNRHVGAVQVAAQAGRQVTPDPTIDGFVARMRAVADGDLEFLERKPMAPTAHVPKKLGELLLEAGLVTESELEEALREQSAEPESRKLGELLLDEVRISPAQLEAALVEQQRDPSKKLGDVLLELGFLDPDDLREALERQRAPRRSKLGEILVRRGVVPAKTIAQAMRSQRLVVNMVRVGATAAVVGVAVTTPYIASAQTGPATAGGSVVVSIVGGIGPDSSGDGMSDSTKELLGLDPLSNDADGDGIPDVWEIMHGMDPLNPDDAHEDWSGDGMSNYDKYLADLSPHEVDTDGDGWWDIIELERGYDPNDPASMPTPSTPEDVNADGKIDASDVQIVINAALGVPTPVPANVTGVGGVNALDVQLVILGALK